MPASPNRRNAIEEAIKKSNQLGETALGPRQIEIRGQVRSLPSYRIPIKALAYNVKNGRFKAELLELETQQQRSLDPLNQDDSKKIREMLLIQEENKTKDLLEDIKRIGQTDPGIITCDGFVINGNKRMAILEQLLDQEPNRKYEYLVVLVLPEEVEDKDLWRLEAGLQLSQEKRIAYGPINDLLKIAEGVTSGLTHREISSCIFGLSEKQVGEALERLLLIELYLEYIEMPKSYKLVEGVHEHFINMQKGHSRLKKLNTHPSEIADFQIVCFEAIRAKCGHPDIRQLQQIFSKKEHFRRAFAKLVDAKRANKLTGELIEDAINVKKNEEYTERPQRLIDRAVDMLKLIKTDSAPFIDVSTESIEDLKEVVDDLKFKHKKAQKHGAAVTKKQ